MPRYEIVAHITREFACETAEEAATMFRRQVLAEESQADALLHLAVWRDEPVASSPLPPSLRQQLLAFFAGLERCAGEAEEAFRGRVEAILAGSAAANNSERVSDFTSSRNRLSSE